MQSMHWKHPGSPHPKKFKRVSLAGKVMASVFWDSQGVIIEQGRTINGAYYAVELTEAFAPANCKKEERKIDSSRSALAGQCACSHVASCHD